MGSVWMGEKLDFSSFLLVQTRNDTPKFDLYKHELRFGFGNCSKEAVAESILYSYKHGFSGFAAWLTDSQAEMIAGFSLKSLLKINRWSRNHEMGR